MSDNSTSNRRIVKNTLLLYFRTILILIVSVYTSRVVLEVLGVDDYGIYNAVGGVVAMFSVLTGALSNSISRFITFEIGRGNKEKLNRIFSMSINIQVLLSIIVVVLIELVGIWFLNSKMSIPEGRLTAANWVLQCSLVVFVIGLLSVPYNACIIAHEHMNAFAYISILDAVLKLLIVFLIQRSPVDKLVSYAILLAIVSLIIRLLYQVYCRKHFEESKYHRTYDKVLFKEMLGFAGWSFFTNANYIINNQGVNILINLFFGVAVNAARGLASQVEGAVVMFVNNFTTAINPQITKSYAAGDKKRMFGLICKGAKFSFFLLLLFSLPFMFETDFILKIWLKEVPEHTAAFIRLSFIASMMTVIGKTGFTACMATGNIRKYVLVLSSVGISTFFLTWIAFEFGMPVEACYVIFAIVYFIVEVLRLYLMKEMLDFPPLLFIKEVVKYIVVVTLVSVIIPFALFYIIPESLLRFIIVSLMCVLSTLLSIAFLGLTRTERSAILNNVKNHIYRFYHKK